jgi:uncharacterized protein involved in exopolysaccharide biosynthesis
MEETPVHALDYLSMVRRRARWLILPIVASIGVGLLLVQFLPKEYTASATIAVLTPSVAPGLVGAPTPLDNSERIRAVSQQLLSPRVLTRVAKRGCPRLPMTRCSAASARRSPSRSRSR